MQPQTRRGARHSPLTYKSALHSPIFSRSADRIEAGRHEPDDEIILLQTILLHRIAIIRR
jgi:hypothetical protein